MHEATQALMERDMSAQVDWLARHAQARGFADLDDLLGRAPAVFTQLAAMWRQAHFAAGDRVTIAPQAITGTLRGFRTSD